MKRTFAALLLISLWISASGQAGNPGLHGRVTWMSSSKISVEYDWSDDSQLLDWIATDGSTLVRGNGKLTITGGDADVSSMIWRQAVRCSRIFAQDAKAVDAPVAHLNFISNVTGWTGYNFNPPAIIGILYSAAGNYWLENTGSASLAAPEIKAGDSYTIDINISATAITARSSSNNMIYSRTLASPPEPDRQVAVGGWGGTTEWGKVIIEGEVDTEWQPRQDMIDIQSGGSAFSPILEVTGNPVIEWIFNDGTTSSSTAPAKDYGTPGVRHNLLKVTPWSSLVGINAGYDAADGGYGGFAMVPVQNILGFTNLGLAGPGLQYICASYSPLSEIDLSELGSLRFVELLKCPNLADVTFGNHPALERICLEDCNLSGLDISGCPALKDLRAASNRYTTINWGRAGAALWHICIRSNPQLTSPIPELATFPALRELLIWDDNQSGAFVCHSNIIESIEANGNHYTSLDISGCTSVRRLELSGSPLAAVNLGSPVSLVTADLKNCMLTGENVDYVLNTLDAAGRTNGTLDLSENSPPSAEGMIRYNSLRSKGWTVSITRPGEKIAVTAIELSGASGVTTINTDGGTLQITAVVSPVIATDRSLTWSVIYGSRLATVDAAGVVTAEGNGIVKVRAAANDGSGVYGEIAIMITNQVNGVPEEDYRIGKLIVTAGELRILFENDFTSWRACLYNLRGNMLSAENVEGDELVFNITDFPPGFYLVVLVKGNIVRVTEFVKR